MSTIKRPSEIPITPGTFNAAACEGIEVGICVILEGDLLIYAGCLENAPSLSDRLLLLHPEDFIRLEALANKRKH